MHLLRCSSVAWLVALPLTGCAMLSPPLTAFPAEPPTANVGDLKPDIARLFTADAKNAKVLKISIAAPDWNLERNAATGVILRRSIEAHIGYQDGGDASRCFVDSSLSFSEQSTGPNTWGPLAIGGVIPGRDPRKIGCELLR